MIMKAKKIMKGAWAIAKVPLCVLVAVGVICKILPFSEKDNLYGRYKYNY